MKSEFKEKVARDISNIKNVPLEEARIIVDATISSIYNHGYAITWARYGQPK